MQCRTYPIMENDMNSEQRVGMVYLALEDQKRDGKGGRNIGGLSIQKRDGTSAYGTLVAELIWLNNGTIKWDRKDKTNGSTAFDNIYQYMAAEIYAESDRQRDRMLASVEHESEVRSGLMSLARWLDEQYAVPVFRCKETGSGNLITTITVHPDLIIDPINGTTAEEAQKKRDAAALAGQTRAAYKRISRDSGETEARKALFDAFNTALATPLPGPIRDGE